MKQNIDRLFGWLLIHNNELVRTKFPLINPDWMVLTVHKHIYEAMLELYTENNDIDILTVSTKLREQGKLKQVGAITVSRLTNDFGYCNFESILNECEYEYRQRQMQIVARDLTEQTTGDIFNVDACLEISERIKTTLLSNAQPKNKSNVEVIMDVIQKHNDAKNGTLSGLQIGWSCTDRKIVLEDIDVMVVGGRPAMGKTAWMVSAIKQLAFNQNKRVAVFSLEMSATQMMRRLLANLSGIDSNKIKFGQCTKSELDKIYAIQELEEWNNVQIFDGSMTVLDITKHVTDMKNTGGCDVYLVDYLQKVIPAKSDTRYAEVTRISNDIKRLTMALKIPAIALAQLSRDSAKTGKRPTLPDLKESGEIEQDASIVGFLHRSEYYGVDFDDDGQPTTGKGEFLLAKNREGVTGVVEMDVDLTTSTWTDPKPIWNDQQPDPAPQHVAKQLNGFEMNDENPF